MAEVVPFAVRPKPLPSKWDGVPVEWTDWKWNRTTIIYHAPADQLVCGKCGSVDECIYALGKRPAVEGEMWPSTRTKQTKSGRKYEVAVQVQAWPVFDLIAARCRHCGHDIITDKRTGEAWELDESDYGPEGSTEPDHGRLF